MSRELSLSQLTTELTDFLGLPADLDLPLVRSIECKRTTDTGWKIQAFVEYRTDTQAYAAIAQWARYAGGEVAVSKPYVGSAKPSGLQRTLSTRIVVAEVPIELLACVDGLFTAPQPEVHARHIESDAERGICRNCGAATADSYCSNPQPESAVA